MDRRRLKMLILRRRRWTLLMFAANENKADSDRYVATGFHLVVVVILSENGHWW